ncbi:guanylate-binding n-terminal domain-containing protein, partial [Cystoisospora suis]
MESFFMNTRSKRILSLFFPSSSSSSSIPEPLSSSSFKTPDCISNPSNREAVLSLSSSSLRSTSSVRRRCASLSLQDSQEDIHPTSSSSSSSSSSLSSSSCRFSSLPLLCSAKRSFLYRRSHFSPWSFRFSFLLSSKFILLQFLLFLCCFLVSLLLSLSSSSSVLFFSPGFSSFTSSSSSFFFYPPHVREATPSRLSSPVNKSLSSSFSIFPSSVVFSPEAIASPITFAEATPNLLPSSSLLSSSSSLSYGLSLALLSSAAGGLVEPSLLQGVSAATKDKQKNRATGKAHTREIRKSKQNKKKKSKKKEKSAPATRHKPRVVQVVRPNERHTGLEIDEEALAYIEAIPAPVSIVTAVGSIHTGKSFFLSQLLAFSYPEDHYDGPPPYEVDLPPSSRSSPSQRYNSTSSSTSSSSTRFTAFPVGYTVHPGTQGLSFWSEPLRVDRRTGRVKTDYDDEDEEEEDREGSDYEDEEEEDDVVEGANKRRRRGSDERKEEETGEEDEEEEEDDEEDDQEEDDEDVKRTMNRKGRDKKASSSENIRKMKRRNEEQTEESDEDHITNVLLLDTEGFGGPNVTRSYDQLLYAVSSLMSSEILFTTMKMIDAQSLQFLEDLTRDANLFNLRAHAQSVNDTRTIVPSSSSSRFSSSSSFSREEPRSEREGEDQGTKELDSWTSPSSSSSEKSDQEKNTKTSTNEHTDSSSSSSGSEQRGSKPRDRNEAQETAVAVSSSSSLEEYVASSSLFSSLTPCCLSWIVQDFVQDLEGHTALQWLERLIDTNRWSASAAEVEKQFWREKKKERGKSSSSDQDGSEGGKSTQLGHSLRSFYTSVDCVALPAPSASSDALQRLDLLPLSEMTAVYKSEFQAFKEKLLKRVANNYKVKNTLFHPSPGGHRIDDEKKKLLSSSLSKQPHKTKRSSCSRRATSSSYQGKPGDRSSSEKEEEEARGDLQCETERGEEEDREEEERQHARGDNEDEKRKGGKNEKLRNLSKEERSSSSSPGGKKGAKTSRFYGLEKVAMSGKDVAALLKFLVRAANLNMFEDIQIFMNHFSTVRSDLAKNDLLLLFEEDMQKFLSVYPPPLPPLFFSFSESLRSKLLQQWQQQIQGQEGLHAQRIQHQQQDDMIKQLNEKVDRFRLIAGEQVRKYCRSFCEKQFRELHARVQEQQQRLPISPQTLAEWATYEQR